MLLIQMILITVVAFFIAWLAAVYEAWMNRRYAEEARRLYRKAQEGNNHAQQ